VTVETLALAAILAIPVSLITFAFAFKIFFLEVVKANKIQLEATLRHSEETQQVGGTPVAVVQSERQLMQTDKQHQFELAQNDRALQHEFQIRRLEELAKRTPPPFPDVVGVSRETTEDEETARAAMGD
jgi:hypothetical protein